MAFIVSAIYYLPCPHPDKTIPWVIYNRKQIEWRL